MKEDAKVERSRDALVGNGSTASSAAQANTSATDSELNDDLMEQVPCVFEMLCIRCLDVKLDVRSATTHQFPSDDVVASQ